MHLRKQGNQFMQMHGQKNGLIIRVCTVYYDKTLLDSWEMVKRCMIKSGQITKYQNMIQQNQHLVFTFDSGS